MKPKRRGRLDNDWIGHPRFEAFPLRLDLPCFDPQKTKPSISRLFSHSLPSNTLPICYNFAKMLWMEKALMRETVLHVLITRPQQFHWTWTIWFRKYRRILTSKQSGRGVSPKNSPASARCALGIIYVPLIFHAQQLFCVYALSFDCFNVLTVRGVIGQMCPLRQ